jgi:hypothetical protein
VTPEQFFSPSRLAFQQAERNIKPSTL